MALGELIFPLITSLDAELHPDSAATASPCFVPNYKRFFHGPLTTLTLPGFEFRGKGRASLFDPPLLIKKKLPRHGTLGFNVNAFHTLLGLVWKKMAKTQFRTGVRNS